MAFLTQYGVARHIYIPMVKRGVVDHAVGADWTPAAGDVKISKDGGAAANVTNLPSAIAMGNSALWDFSLTATELQAAQVMVTIADSATKAVEDNAFVIETYGNASAEHAVNLNDSVRAGLTALPNAAAEAAGGLYTRGSGAGQINQPANGQIDANTVKWNGTAVASPATAGIPDVNVKNINNVSASPVTTVKAVQGLTTADTIATYTGNTKQTGDVYAALPANFSSFVIDASGRVNAFLIGILTSVFTEGATGRVAAAFKQFFNIATPAATMDHGVLVDTATTLTNAPGDSSGTTSLLSRLTSTRAGYLDNLSGGAVALASKVKRYAQLLARKDAAIATDAATELGELNENVASGAGSFDNTTDAQEALRDNVGSAGAGLTSLGDARLAHLDADVSTRLPTSSYAAPLDAAGTRSALGLGSANLDTQLGNADLTATVADSVPADGTRPSVAQAAYMIVQLLTDAGVSGTTLTIRKPDGSTTLFECTLNDGTTPTDITRST